MNQIRFTVETTALSRFTTLLQAGTFIETDQGTSVGDFLFALPDFSREYIATRIQTIFLNGLPADSLDQKLFGLDAVLAISAAMPGLAGAIFRKDGVHASLRTQTANELSPAETAKNPLTIRLKLFNMIAAEKGVQLLNEGCVLSASSLKRFLDYRPPLLASIQTLTINDTLADTKQLQHLLLSEKMILLTVRGNHDN